LCHLDGEILADDLIIWSGAEAFETFSRVASYVRNLYMNLKSLAVVTFGGMLLFLVSCSPAQRFYQAQTKVPQKPWQGTSGKWGGYSDKKLPNGGHSVRFMGYNEPDQSSCAYFVTVRAAELSVLDGKTHFFSSGVTTNIAIEESNFPMRVIPGYWDEVPFVEYISDGKGNVIPANTYRSIWVPPSRIPPHTAINKINTASLSINYNGTGKKYYSVSILQGAHTNQQKLGKVSLDPKVVEFIKAVRSD
jgi:hypothetical protein